MDRIYSLATVRLVICLVPGPVLEARDGAVSKMEASPCPHDVHILVRGGSNKVVNGSSTQALHAGGSISQTLGRRLCESVRVCMPWGPQYLAVYTECFGDSSKESMVGVGSPEGVR